MKAVAHALYLKIAGWNLLRAAFAFKMGRLAVRKGLRDRIRRWLGWLYHSAAIRAHPSQSRALIHIQPAFA
jgi:hypothetical protein